ncbi:zinc finger MYM-type protein 1-like [Anthonomus grandis grandis]|uniref:zinc finger MYM-type protein 1-like n=1 Tax=Anthonomus grandis grandis TaxID=2921223 RepID=UPI0021657AB6|nr:zinc finger MYM-type protein 1-like [Anthonomus grandis grandis]
MASKGSMKNYFSIRSKSPSPDPNKRKNENGEVAELGKKRKTENNEQIEREKLELDENGPESADRSNEDINEAPTSNCNVEREENNWSQFSFLLDLSKSPYEKPSQPILREYPGTKIGDRLRAFNKKWFKTFPWLEYSVIENKAFCFYCRFFCKSYVKEKSFITGYNRWKKAMETNSGFTAHSNSLAHKECLLKYNEFKRSSSVGGVENLIKNKNKELIEENRYYIKTLAEILLLTCKLEIAQRGHNESTESANKGNFLELTEFVANHDPVFKKKVSSAAVKSKYLHSSIQNELLQILSNEVLQSARDEISEAKFYSVLADETKDLSKKEQMAILIRYIYKLEIKEIFLGFIHCEKLDATSLFATIKNTLLKNGILLENCVGQAYNGASVMSGHLNGVQALFKKEVPSAVYVHCYNHVLNLAVVDCCKGIPEFSQFFNMTEQLYIFMSHSSIPTEFLNVQKRIYPGKQPKELTRLQQTIWSIQYKMCSVLEDTFESLYVTLYLVSSRNSDRGLEAKRLLHSLTKTFNTYIVCFKDVLNIISSLSDYLQSKDIDYARANILVEEILQQLQLMIVENSYWDAIWERVNILWSLTGASDSSEAIPKRKKQLPARFKMFFTELEAENELDTSKKGLKIGVFFSSFG